DRRAGTLRLETQAEPLGALVAVGAPLGQPVLWAGPFALTTREALADVQRRHAGGALGRLEPSF
ncbi:MAG: hypothetical protein JNK82_17505, partial [Myxococcaceae bacterium]|nr:hypothetical protein [Myxococcaceae bacterium]